MTLELDFEAAVRPLDLELTRLERTGANPERIEEVRAGIDRQLAEIYGGLTPWQKVQVARHRERPYFLDYVRSIFSDFVELHGDRRFGDDRAVLGGPAVLDGITVMVIGHQKGRDTKDNVEHNFGMPNPEGYRKAIRLFRQAEKFRFPVITFVDTPGANPSLPAEERGQAQAIAESIAVMLALRTPIISIVTGEGGSGGALALAVADRILMLEHSVFTVASPEAAASILWRDSTQAPEAAATMKITAADLLEIGIIDGIIPEPIGGAHRDHATTARNVRDALGENLQALSALSEDELVRRRSHKFRHIDHAVQGG